jgi:hypothetical protein
MAPKRLYEVARELALQNRQLAAELESMGYRVRSFASFVTDEELRALYLKHGCGEPGESPG